MTYVRASDALLGGAHSAVLQRPECASGRRAAIVRMLLVSHFIEGREGIQWGWNQRSRVSRVALHCVEQQPHPLGSVFSPALNCFLAPNSLAARVSET
jgi:hypothetical protein